MGRTSALPNSLSSGAKVRRMFELCKTKGLFELIINKEAGQMVRFISIPRKHIGLFVLIIIRLRFAQEPSDTSGRTMAANNRIGQLKPPM